MTFLKIIGLLILAGIVVSILTALWPIIVPLAGIISFAAIIVYGFKSIATRKTEEFPTVRNKLLAALVVFLLSLIMPTRSPQEKVVAEPKTEQLQAVDTSTLDKQKEEEKKLREIEEKERDLKQKEDELKRKELALKEAEKKKKEEEKKLAESKLFEVATVASTTDGDTITVRINDTDYKLRLIGVDTPETVHPNKPVEFMGQEASDFTHEQLQDKDIRLEKDVSDKDKYQRLLRYVRIEEPADKANPTYEDVRDKTINGILVREGYANASTYPPDVKYQEYFSRIEEEAREAGKGLWNEENLAVYEESQAPAEETETANAGGGGGGWQETNNPSQNNGMIKGNSNSMIYHVPGGQFYDKVAEHNAVYFNTEEEAQAAGYRRSKR